MSIDSSISPEISPGSTVSKSTNASSGSIRLTSISLNGSLSVAFRRGVVGVFGRPELGVLGRALGVFGLDPSYPPFVGEPGRDLVFRRDLDSVDIAALNFLAFPSRLGVVERDITELESSEVTESVESGRLAGVKETGRASLLAEGVAGTDIMECFVDVS